MFNFRNLLIWPIHFGTLFAIGALAKIATVVKKWRERKKDEMSAGPLPADINAYNNNSLNKAIVSVSQSLGYLVTALLLTSVPAIMNLLAAEWNDIAIFQCKEIFFQFLIDIILPGLYYYRKPELRKFVNDAIIDVI